MVIIIKIKCKRKICNGKFNTENLHTVPIIDKIVVIKINKSK